MIVFINEKKTSVFKGATLADAVLTYSKKNFKKVRDGSLGIFDRFGFLTEPDGPAMEGQHYFLKELK
jgi:hypothetical protein